MSDEVMSQGESDAFSISDDEDGFDDYYNNMNDCDDAEMDSGQDKVDPEHFEFTLLKLEDVEQLLNESVEALSKATNVSAYG